MKYCLLATALLLSACATHPARPTSWAGFHGPAYLPVVTTRRPPQRVRDSLARAARQPALHLLTK
ncbi:MAG: hypothetical protein ACRYF0_19720 [Janthinobacterium lividum]